MIPIFDSNILIDHLNRVPEAREEIERYPRARISVITWIEIMAGVIESSEEAIAADLLGCFEVAGIDETVREQAVALRRKYRLKLPDAIIWATAEANNALLVTRNHKDFPSDHPSIRIPYRL